MDDLLEIPPGGRRSTVFQFKEYPPEASHAVILRYVVEWKTVRMRRIIDQPRAGGDMITGDALARMSLCVLPRGIPMGRTVSGTQPSNTGKHTVGTVARWTWRKNRARRGRVPRSGSLTVNFLTCAAGGPITSPLKGKGQIRGPQVVSWSWPQAQSQRYFTMSRVGCATLTHVLPATRPRLARITGHDRTTAARWRVACGAPPWRPCRSPG